VEIEIITAKKKLSKSIVNQMRQAHTVVLKFGTSLGYMIGVKKGAYRTILIQYDKEFFTIPDNYTKGDTKVYRKTGKWTQTKEFETHEECTTWWEAYQERLQDACNQIYI